MTPNRIDKKYEDLVYPVTLVKWVLAKRYISNFLRTGRNKEKIIIPKDTGSCLYCNGNCCKFHKSMNNVLESKCLKLSDDIFVTRNEIFSFENSILRICYCPHFSQIRVPIQRLCRRSILFVQLIEVDLQEQIQPDVLKSVNVEDMLPISCWFAGDLDIVATKDGDFYLWCKK